jgi:hypothetical protein
MKYIFVGPSGYNLPNHLFSGWIRKPPCKQSDILKLIESEQPTHIALVDGLYMSVPAPWHKEILLAIENNICVYGCSSMGALRAAELHTFGMKGFGSVFNYIVDNEPVDDSIVAVVHDSFAQGFKPLTFAKIELIHFYQLLVQASLISFDQASFLSERLTDIHFESLSKLKLFSELQLVGLADPEILFDELFVSIKQADLQRFLLDDFSSIQHHQVHIQSFNLFTSRTPYIYRQLALDYDSPFFNGGIDDNRLSFQAFTALYNSRIHDAFCLKAHSLLLLQAFFNACCTNPCNPWFTKKLAILRELYPSLIDVNFSSVDFIRTDGLDNLPFCLNNLFPCESLDSLSDLDFNTFINFTLHPAVIGRAGNCQLDFSSSLKILILVNLKLSLLLHVLYNAPHAIPCDFYISSSGSLPVLFNERHSLSLFFARYFERLKSLSLNFFHGSLIVSKLLLDDHDLGIAYKNFMIPPSPELPYRLYLESYQTDRTDFALESLQELNTNRLLVIRPSTSLGTHFLDIKYLLRFALSYYDI